MLKLLSFFGVVTLITAPITSSITDSNSAHQRREVKDSDPNLELNQTSLVQKKDSSLTQSLQAKTIQNSQNKINFDHSTFNIMGRDATVEEIKRFSYLVPNYQWFTKLVSDESFGYTEAPKTQILQAEEFGKNGTGLCEYIALSTIITYHELFISSGYFTDYEWKKVYFRDPPMYGDKVGLSVHNNYEYINKEKSFITRLWELNGKKKDLKSGKSVSSAFKGWTRGSSIDSLVQTKTCAPWWHSSQPENYLIKYNLPIILTTAKNGGHSVVVYGYDNNTKSYLVHYGWNNHPTVIIKKSDIWGFWLFGFWNAFFYSSTPPSTNLRQAFGYQGQKYSWKELQTKGITWDQVDSA